MPAKRARKAQMTPPTEITLRRNGPLATKTSKPRGRGGHRCLSSSLGRHGCYAPSHERQTPGSNDPVFRSGVPGEDAEQMRRETLNCFVALVIVHERNQNDGHLQAHALQADRVRNVKFCVGVRHLLGLPWHVRS